MVITVLLVGVICHSITELQAASESVNVQAVSIAMQKAQSPVGSSFSGDATVSGDGRYIVFSSQAGNLTTNLPVQDVSGMYLNVYVRDLLTQETKLVSVSKSGNRTGRGHSISPGISRDGRYIAFQSEAEDLVDGDANEVSDVFIRDMQDGVTKLVSVKNGTSESGDDASGVPTITPDGRFVVFESLASDLTPEDTNGISDVFVRDLEVGETILVSAGFRDSSPPSGVYSEFPSISVDGQVIAYTSSGLNPALGLTNVQTRVFWHHLRSGTTSVVRDQALTEAVGDARN